MMSNALKLIAAAEKLIGDEKSGIIRRRGNPFGKAWGLQIDGDLWEQARGIGNKSLRKVKGHATEKYIENGISNPEDKEGNDVSDKLADKGVEAIAGIGLVKRRKWLEARLNKYRKLMNRVHKMIAAATIAEKRREEEDTHHPKGPPWIRPSQVDQSRCGSTGRRPSGS